VVTANGLMQRGADSTFAFAQDANFWYLTGLDEPDIILVIDRDNEFLIVPTRSASRQAFDGALEPELLVQRSGVQTVLDDTAGWDRLGGRLRKVKHAATLAIPPAYVEHYGMYTNPARGALVERIKTLKPDIEQHKSRNPGS
jgi:Xaa-Pro aminopeptidase